MVSSNTSLSVDVYLIFLLELSSWTQAYAVFFYFTGVILLTVTGSYHFNFTLSSKD